MPTTENTDPASGRVTRSLRKRLTSIDGDALSRPGTPINTNLQTISETITPLKRTTRRASLSTPVPLTPSKAKNHLDSAIEFNTPGRRSTRRRSVNISELEEHAMQTISKEPTIDVVQEEEPQIQTKTSHNTRSASKSPQEQQISKQNVAKLSKKKMLVEPQEIIKLDDSQEIEPSNTKKTRVYLKRGENIKKEVSVSPKSSHQLGNELTPTKKSPRLSTSGKNSNKKTNIIDEALSPGNKKSENTKEKKGSSGVGLSTPEINTSKEVSLKEKKPLSGEGFSTSEKDASVEDSSTSSGKKSKSDKSGSKINEKSPKTKRLSETSQEQTNSSKITDQSSPKNTEQLVNDEDETETLNSTKNSFNTSKKNLKLSSDKTKNSPKYQQSPTKSQLAKNSPHKKNRPEQLKNVAFDDTAEENTLKNVYPKTPGLTKSKSYILDSSKDVAQDTSYKSKHGQSFEKENAKKSDEENSDEEEHEVLSSKTPYKLKLKAVESSTPIQNSSPKQKKTVDVNEKKEESIKGDWEAKEEEGVFFPKSWNQSVSGTVRETSKIDSIASEKSIKEKNKSQEAVDKSRSIISQNSRTNSYHHESDDSFGEDDMLEEDNEDYDNDDEEEPNEGKSIFLDDEAMEVPEGEESMDSEEREYLEQNEIPVYAESIGSEDSDSEGYDDEADEEDAAFIISDTEVIEEDEEDEKPESESPKKKYKRIRQVSETSDEDRPNITKDDPDLCLLVDSSVEENEHDVKSPNKSNANINKLTEVVDDKNTSRNSVTKNDEIKSTKNQSLKKEDKFNKSNPSLAVQDVSDTETKENVGNSKSPSKTPKTTSVSPKKSETADTDNVSENPEDESNVLKSSEKKKLPKSPQRKSTASEESEIENQSSFTKLSTNLEPIIENPLNKSSKSVLLESLSESQNKATPNGDKVDQDQAPKLNTPTKSSVQAIIAEYTDDEEQQKLEQIILSLESDFEIDENLLDAEAPLDTSTLKANNTSKKSLGHNYLLEEQSSNKKLNSLQRRKSIVQRETKEDLSECSDSTIKSLDNLPGEQLSKSYLNNSQRRKSIVQPGIKEDMLEGSGTSEKSLDRCNSPGKQLSNSKLNSSQRRKSIVQRETKEDLSECSDSSLKSLERCNPPGEQLSRSKLNNSKRRKSIIQPATKEDLAECSDSSSKSVDKCNSPGKQLYSSKLNSSQRRKSIVESETKEDLSERSDSSSKSLDKCNSPGKQLSNSKLNSSQRRKSIVQTETKEDMLDCSDTLEKSIGRCNSPGEKLSKSKLNNSKRRKSIIQPKSKEFLSECSDSSTNSLDKCNSPGKQLSNSKLDNSQRRKSIVPPESKEDITETPDSLKKSKVSLGQSNSPGEQSNIKMNNSQRRMSIVQQEIEENTSSESSESEEDREGKSSSDITDDEMESSRNNVNEAQFSEEENPTNETVLDFLGESDKALSPSKHNSSSRKSIANESKLDETFQMDSKSILSSSMHDSLHRSILKKSFNQSQMRRNAIEQNKKDMNEDGDEEEEENTTDSDEMEEAKVNTKLVSAKGLSVSLNSIQIKKNKLKDAKSIRNSFTIGVSVRKDSLDDEESSEKSEVPLEDEGKTKDLPEGSASSDNEASSDSECERPVLSEEEDLEKVKAVHHVGPYKSRKSLSSSIFQAPASETENNQQKRIKRTSLYLEEEVASKSFVENLAEEKKKIKQQKRKSNSFCGVVAPSLGGDDEQLVEPKSEKKLKKTSEAKGNISHILNRCEQIMEAANQAKRVAKLNAKKVKVKKPKWMNKEEELTKEEEEVKIPLVSKKEIKRKELAKAVKQSYAILAKTVQPTKKSIQKTIPEKLENSNNSSKRLEKEFLESLVELSQPKKKKIKENLVIPPSENENKDSKKKRPIKSQHTIEDNHEKNQSDIERLETVCGTVIVEPSTPQRLRIQNGFRESPKTPVGFKIQDINSNDKKANQKSQKLARKLLTASGSFVEEDLSQSVNNLKKIKSRKRKLPDIEEPSYTLPKTQWTPSGVFVEEDLYSARPLANSTATQFLVTSLNGGKKNKSSSSKVVSTTSLNSALSFKQSSLQHGRVPRQSSREILHCKQRKIANNQF